MVFKTVIIGSSHVERLRQYLLKPDVDLVLSKEKYEVSLMGFSGGHVSTLFRTLFDLFTNKPDHVLIQIGSNDISNVETNVETVAWSIQHLYQTLISIGIKHVTVGFLFYRQKVRRSRGLTLAQYNARVDELNRLLFEMPLYCPQLTLWRHRGLRFPNVQILRNDGVHLNNEGLKRLMRNIRGAIMHAEKVLNGKISILFC